LVSLSTFVREHGAVALAGGAAGLIVLAILFRGLRRYPAGARVVDFVKLHLPILGPRHYTAAVARFSRSFGMLLANEVPVVESAGLAAEAADNVILRDAVHAAAGHIENGDTIADALNATDFFPGIYCWTLDHAERAGTVDQALIGLAGDAEEDVARRDKLIMQLSGPVAVLVLGIFVAFMVLALYLPICLAGDAVIG